MDKSEGSFGKFQMTKNNPAAAGPNPQDPADKSQFSNFIQKMSCPEKS
jgi:hypothetical protein